MNGTRSGGGMSGKQRIAKRQLFPEKLWDLVNRPASGIQWSPDGKKIQVERTQLEKYIGTKFRSHNFDSFIRQLHFYGFRKCGNSYHHDKFQRGQPDALLTMKRKYSNLNSLCNVDLQSNASSNEESILDNSKCNVDDLDNYCAAIDYSKTSSLNRLSRRVSDTSIGTGCSNSPKMKSCNSQVNNNVNRNAIPPSTLIAIDNTEAKESLNDYQNDKKEIIMYTFRPVDAPTETTYDSVLSYTNFRQDSAKIDSSDSKSIKITLPEVMQDTTKNAWPKTLVLNSYWDGSQNILSAYFLYKTNQ